MNPNDAMWLSFTELTPDTSQLLTFYQRITYDYNSPYDDGDYY